MAPGIIQGTNAFEGLNSVIKRVYTDRKANSIAKFVDIIYDMTKDLSERHSHQANPFPTNPEKQNQEVKKAITLFQNKKFVEKEDNTYYFCQMIKQSQQKKTSNTSRILEQLMLKLIVTIFFVSDKFSRTQITLSLYVSATTTSNIYTVATQSAANITNRKKKVNS